MSERNNLHGCGGVAHRDDVRWRVGGLCVVLVVALNLVTASPAMAGNGAEDHITGSVTIEHIGNHSDREPGRAIVEFAAFAATPKHPARGFLTIDIMGSSGEIGRRITVRITDVWANGTEGAFLGVVTADVKSSEKAEAGGDDASEPGHESGHDEPGTEPGHEEEPGTEPGHETGHGSDDEGPGDHATGKDRTGQVIAVKVTDRGSPGRVDTLDWKWFLPGTISLDWVIGMDQLCDVGPKVILGGNIAVHTKVIKTSKSTPRTAR